MKAVTLDVRDVRQPALAAINALLLKRNKLERIRSSGRPIDAAMKPSG